MNVLMFGTDERVFKANEEVRSRTLDYGTITDNLHVIVYTAPGFIEEHIENVHLYPTNTRFRPFYFLSCIRIAKILYMSDTKNKWVVSAQDPFETGMIATWIAFQWKAKLQIQVHTDFLSPYFSVQSIKNKARVFIGKKVVKHADGIRVVSKRIKKSIINLFASLENRISILPIIVPLSHNVEEKPKPSTSDFIILMASRLTKEKNINMALCALSLIREKKNLQLHIVGDGPELASIKRQIKKLKLEKYVVLKPWTTDLASYYQSAHLFLLTSNYEGYGRTVIEALGHNLPVMMTDVGIAGDIILDRVNGFIVPVGDIEKLASYIEEIMQNPVLLHSVLRVIKSKKLDVLDKNKYLQKYKEILQTCITTAKHI